LDEEDHQNRPGGMMERLGNKLINVKFVLSGFAFVEEDNIFNFMPV
jgi:hypothetical protein